MRCDVLFARRDLLFVVRSLHGAAGALLQGGPSEGAYPKTRRRLAAQPKFFRWAGLLVSGNGEVARVVIIYYIYRLYKKEPSPSPQKARLMPRTIRTIPTNNDRLIFTDFGI